MVRFADLKMAVDSVRSKLMNTQHRKLREEQRVVEENYPDAKADLKEQTAKLTAAEEEKNTNKALLDHLLRRQDEFQSHFDQAPKMEQNIKTYQITKELFEYDIAIYTVVVNDDVVLVDNQRRKEIDSHQRLYSLISRAAKIPQQLGVLEYGIAAQRALVSSSTQILNNFLVQVVNKGITRLLMLPLPHEFEPLTSHKRDVLANSNNLLISILKQWVI